MEQLSPSKRTGGDDAVAFTSGPQGAPFSAGVVHAWLAADREKPLVATGISMGAIAAAAMRRVYQELEHPDTDDLEMKRWRWYQQYYEAVTDNPLGPLWNALPNPVDFFSETPPATDPSVPRELYEESENSRRHYYLLTKLGVWLANLPVRVSTIATILVMYVRRTEGYGFKLLTWISFYWNLCIALVGLLFHVVRSPQWVWESAFGSEPRRKLVRPLLGWMIHALAVLLPLLAIGALALCVWLLYFVFGFAQWEVRFRWPLIFAVVVGCLLAADQLVFRAFTSSGTPGESAKAKTRTWLGALFLRSIWKNLDITKGLLHPYEIRRAIHDLFVQDAPDYVMKGPAPDDVKALFVCAALEETEQIVLRENMKVVDALTAAVAIPGILPPQGIDAEWIATRTAERLRSFQIIDGAAVRTNPLPAFFDWCKRIGDPIVAERLECKDGIRHSMHVVYAVPTSFEGSAQDAPGMECPDIVLSAQKAIQLAKRRDTRQEVRQANNLSRLEWLRRKVSKVDSKRKTFVILADEIAPRKEIDLGNELSPNHGKLRTTVADGCRATLETLYRQDIGRLSAGLSSIPCAELLQSIAPRRTNAVAKQPGLQSVCNSCTRLLEHRPAEDPNAVQRGIVQTFGRPAKPEPAELAKMFPQLAEEKQKVVFLGSGGVFRGSFHIGVLAAIYQTGLYPDLVVGASVGTLMGGALCRMTAGGDSVAPQVLSDLTTLFTSVDKKVSLTFNLKNAAKQLGIRAREIRLSPSELARKVRSGSKADAGYAATGAPPVFTDALSCLFTIPHRNTAAITSQFIAGHFSQAVARFLREVRRETLTSFEIRNCVMGVSLLEAETRRLLAFTSSGAELTTVQPYQNKTTSKRQVAFFGTTSFLNASASLLLGRDFLTTSPSWSATQAGLCSSAFPAVFAPRTEADLIPGGGRIDRFFADGGMFDNLPFFPALEVLSAVQHAAPYKTPEDLQALVRGRAANPNLIISAGLNEKPLPDSEVRADTMFAVHDRATTLSYESKTNTFATSAKKSLEILDALGSGDLRDLTDNEWDSLNGHVGATIVGITPTDAAHINPTFAFCKSLQMRSTRVRASIGDGCFRSLYQFSQDSSVNAKLEAAGKGVTPIRRTVVAKPICQAVEVKIGPGGFRDAVTSMGGTAGSEPPEANLKQPPFACPYFMVGHKQFSCPFTMTKDKDTGRVYDVCKSDLAHQAAWHSEKTAS